MWHNIVFKHLLMSVGAFIQCCVLLLYSVVSYADDKFLPEDQAFIFDARSIKQDTAELSWTIAPDYYLYKHQFSIQVNQQPITFQLPQAKDKFDDYFGQTEVYYHQLNIQIKTQPNQSYQVSYQGCAEKGLCYPLSQTSFATDQDGLVILANPKTQTQAGNIFSQASNASSHPSSETAAKKIEAQADVNAEDQQWSKRLHEQSFLISVLVFLGLGCLLAFTPCSLPMLPILSSLLIRKHEGVKAIAISVVFVLCMALVYAFLGVLAASAGSNLQRWLQQPFVLIGFSSIFIIFALNLFGLFELKLPQVWANRLDKLQSQQQGGTLIGAGVMGILSALLVGPCMTAPLAGTLLYISQTQNLWLGAVLLFCLGLGMGIPLILLTLLGQKAVPKPGIWMNYVRHVFAFLMLGLSLYFIRPLLSEVVLNLGLLAIVIALVIYLIRLIKQESGKVRMLAVVLLLGITSLSIWQSVSYWHYQQNRSAQVWHVVNNQQQLNELLNTAKQRQQAVVIDLYADWCIACQPLEREVWAHPQTEIALDGAMRIKLDLSQYDPAQKQLLQNWELLGPPTALFIAQDGQEQRHLRLTGTFSYQDLWRNMQSLYGKD